MTWFIIQYVRVINNKTDIYQNLANFIPCKVIFNLPLFYVQKK